MGLDEIKLVKLDEIGADMLYEISYNDGMLIYLRAKLFGSANSI